MSLVGFKAKNHPQQKTNPEVDDRATTWEMFNPLNERFHFTIDVAASAENAKLPRFYTTEDDGLAQSWWGERVWCNPPYSNIRPWVEKAATSGAELVVMLLPANRTEQKWWQELIEPRRDRGVTFGVVLETGTYRLRVEFLPGRPRFIRKDSVSVGPNERRPFGCCLVIWERT